MTAPQTALRCGQPGQAASVIVAGCAIRYRIFGTAGAGPDLLFLHGRGANMHWWLPFMPRIAQGRRAVALDLSGCGDSDWRPDGYSVRLFAEEVLGVAAACGLRHPVLIAHSFGGTVGLRAALHDPAALGGLIMVDSRLLCLRDLSAPKDQLIARHLRGYPTRAAALARFRLTPEQPGADPDFLAWLAAQSLRQDPDGWRWKFDGRAVDLTPDMMDPAQVRAALAQMPGPLAAIWGGASPLGTPADQDIAHRLSDRIRHHHIANAGHHIMADQPDALIDCLNDLLATPATAG